MEQTIPEIVGRACFLVTDWYGVLVDVLIPIGVPLLTTIFFGLYIRQDTMRRLDDIEKPYISLYKDEVLRRGLLSGLYNYRVTFCFKNFGKRTAEGIRFRILDQGFDELMYSTTYPNPLNPDQSFTFHMDCKRARDCIREDPVRLRVEITFVDGISGKSYLSKESYLLADGNRLVLPTLN